MSTENKFITEKATLLKDRFCLGKSKYINEKAIVEDLEKLLQSVLSKAKKELENPQEDDIVDFLEENKVENEKYVEQFQSILFVVKSDYMGYGGLKQKINDLGILDELTVFLCECLIKKQNKN